MNQLKVITNTIPTFKMGVSSPVMINQIIRSVRVLYLTALLIFVLLLQTSQATFINVSMLLPIYGLLSFLFLLNSFYLCFYEKVKDLVLANGFMFAMDAVFIAGMNLFSTGNFSLFLILFLLNIILCGLKYESKGAFMLATWTSILFSCLLVYGPQLEGKNLYISLVLNNFSFFSIAFLGGFLSQQFSNLNYEVYTKTHDILDLQKLNELIISNVANGLISVDKSLKITHFNSAAEKILGKDLENKYLEDVLSTSYSKVETILNENKEMDVHRMEILWPTNKEQRTLEFIFSKIKNSHNVHMGYVLLLQDLTQLKSLEAKLRQKEKLAAVGQLAAGIAHEIRNPLASISGSIQLLARSEEGTSDDNKRLMAITIREIDRLNDLISEFLDYVKPESPSDKVVDVNVVLKEIMTGLSVDKNLNANIKQELILNSHRLIQGHPDKLKQAFLNICINAYQAMSHLDFGSIKVQTWDQGDSVIVKIEDQGMGIPPENLERVFEPFHTTKVKGTGLGLAVSHKILESHGATIHLESEINKGTTFTIEFIGSNNYLGNELKIRKQA